MEQPVLRWRQSTDRIEDMTCYSEFADGHFICHGHVYYNGSMPSEPWAAEMPTGGIVYFAGRDLAIRYVEVNAHKGFCYG